MPLAQLLNLDVRPFQADYNAEDASFWYNGRQYFKIVDFEANDGVFLEQKGECIGRISGTHIVIYEVKNDPENTVLFGDIPGATWYFSDRYTECVEKADITGIHLWIYQRNDYGRYVQDEYAYIEEEQAIVLFQDFLENRYQAEPKVFDKEIIKRVSTVKIQLCYDDCPVPRSGNAISFFLYEGKWYLEEAETHYYDNQIHYTYYGYPVENEELQSYLNGFLIWQVW